MYLFSMSKTYLKIHTCDPEFTFRVKLPIQRYYCAVISGLWISSYLYFID